MDARFGGDALQLLVRIHDDGMADDLEKLQASAAKCGVAGAGAGLTSDLSLQVICATEAFGACPATPGKSYPRLTKLDLPALKPQVTMPDPCAGVPSNPWCKK